MATTEDLPAPPYLRELGSIADRLLRGFMAPLVIGGEMTPGHPIGGKIALAFGEERIVGDPDLLSHVALARVRRARQLVPLDRVGSATPAEWALGAILHDIAQATHPGFDAAFRRRSAARLLDVVYQTLEHVPPVTTLGDALSRHTWFARVFEITRTDTVVSWWVGKRIFLGTAPPPRLTSWPELRKVNVAATAHALMELPGNGGMVDDARFRDALASFLAKTPLTDLATLTRAEPRFAWRPETLALIGTHGGRTLALRALGREPPPQVDAALGRATRRLLDQGAWQGAKHVIDLLADRALLDAMATTGGGRAQAAEIKGADALFARAAGALAARERAASGELALHEEEKRRVLAVLDGAVSPAAAKEVEAAMHGGVANKVAAGMGAAAPRPVEA